MFEPVFTIWRNETDKSPLSPLEFTSVKDAQFWALCAQLHSYVVKRHTWIPMGRSIGRVCHRSESYDPSKHPMLRAI